MRRPIPDLFDLMGGARKAAAQARLRVCDVPGCEHPGEHRAPKDRSLSDYFWFCLDHVRDYNKAWNYYEGMDENELELHLRNDTCWQRPTWPLGSLAARMAEAARKGSVEDAFKVFDDEPAGTNKNPTAPAYAYNSPEAKAMRVMDVEEPLTVEQVKTRYRVLVKQHHPDANKGDKQAEERFKKISDAYRTLMKAMETD